MKIESFGISNIGLQRHNNEDAWGVIPEHHFFVVADGMGGHQAGEIAAREAVDSLVKSMGNLLSQNGSFSNEELVLELKEAILETNSWIHHLAQENEEMQGMGTTLCCLLFNQRTAIYAHIGDSRIYRFRGKLERLTEDHSLRKEMAERYHLDEKTAHGLPSKNIITRAVGTSYHVEPEVNSSRLELGDIYFLCSDGLTDLIKEDEIAETLKSHPHIQEACQSLVQTALNYGGNDNITLLMIKIS